jgi:hypothetical protein
MKLRNKFNNKHSGNTLFIQKSTVKHNCSVSLESNLTNQKPLKGQISDFGDAYKAFMANVIGNPNDPTKAFCLKSILDSYDVTFSDGFKQELQYI